MNHNLRLPSSIISLLARWRKNGTTPQHVRAGELGTINCVTRFSWDSGWTPRQHADSKLHHQRTMHLQWINSKPDSDDSRILEVVYRLVKSEYMYKNIADETFAEQPRPALSE